MAYINLSIGPSGYVYVDGSVDSRSDFIAGRPRYYRPGDGDCGFGLFFSTRPSCMAGEAFFWFSLHHCRPTVLTSMSAGYRGLRLLSNDVDEPSYLADDSRRYDSSCHTKRRRNYTNSLHDTHWAGDDGSKSKDTKQRFDCRYRRCYSGCCFCDHTGRCVFLYQTAPFEARVCWCRRHASFCLRTRISPTADERLHKQQSSWNCHTAAKHLHQR